MDAITQTIQGEEMSEDRDCENCKHYKLAGITFDHKEYYACENWNCDFAPKEQENEDRDELWDKLDGEYFTHEELVLCTDLCGFTVETLNNMIHSRYGVSTFDDLKEVSNERE